MTISAAPLSYCTNVHPGRSLAEVEEGLDRYTTAVCRQVGGALAAGLWLAAPVVRELRQSPEVLESFARRLADRGLICYTLNAFPYGDFHSDRVKENVYYPDWSDAARLEYTLGCAEVLSRLLPEGHEGSLSTVPLGFKPGPRSEDFFDRCADHLIALARELARIHERTGRLIRLAIEPEPFCHLETTEEATAFFRRLRERAAADGAADPVGRHIGLCYDVCHQAVEFEDVAASILALQQAEIRIAKVHITCAIELRNPAENLAGREALARYAEPRYLHQVIARSADGTLHRAVDLTETMAQSPEPAFREAETWRVHFHVPVDAESLGPLQTTRADLRRALAAVAQLPYAPHLEVETYTWEVLPSQAQSAPNNLVEGLTREILATRSLLEELQTTPSR